MKLIRLEYAYICDIMIDVLFRSLGNHLFASSEWSRPRGFYLLRMLRIHSDFSIKKQILANAFAA